MTSEPRASGPGTVLGERLRASGPGTVPGERLHGSGPGIGLEERLRAGGVHVAGIDEAGRGPLAGPVVAAAVVFPRGTAIPGVDDSKKLSPAERERLFAIVTGEALAFGVGIVENDLIDEINILNASFLAMDRAVAALGLKPGHLIVDGNLFRPGPATKDIPVTTVVGGDASCFSVAAASIVAKVTRDRLMNEVDSRFPGYGFARNKGYGTAEHRAAILRLGLTPLHRRTFCHVPDVIASGAKGATKQSPAGLPRTERSQ